MEFNYNKIKDPTFFSENRIPARSDHIYYNSHQSALLGDKKFHKVLDGVWKFSYARNYNETIRGFEKVEYDCHAWSNIRVPGHIQLQGYDAPQYVNVQYPWDGREQIEPPDIPEHFNPVANYVKYFTVPKDWDNQQIYVCFDGAESGMALWCNGEYVGYSEDSFTPHAFELTRFLKEAENKLAVQVFKWTSGSWCEDQDFFRFSGLHRSVYLYTTPPVHIHDISIKTELNDAFNEAKLSVDVKTQGRGSCEFLLKDGEEVVCEATYKLHRDICEVSMPISKPKLWSAEKPYLYSLWMTITDTAGDVTEVIHQNVGFRRFEIRDSIMRINGERIVFKGVNRHEFSAKNGRIVNDKEALQDVITMKQNNINAIRTSHYPNSSYIYDLCDKYGLYMIDEANLESHGSWEPSSRGTSKSEHIIVPNDIPEWREAMLDRVNSMYQRDKNHPSILIWSCGNESYGGKNIYDMSQLLRHLDDTRLVHYEGIRYDRRYDDTSDIESQMYTPVEEIKDFLTDNRSKPFICCEYAHAMGNSCGAMYKYTDLSDLEPLYQGGFIWDYIDQCITKKDCYGNDFEAYGGDFDDRPTDYNFSGNGIVYSEDRMPSPKMAEVKYNYQNITLEVSREKVKVINRNLFTSTQDYECNLILKRDGIVVEKTIIDTSVSALSQSVYPILFKEDKAPGEYAIIVSFVLKEDTPWGIRGHEIAFGQHIYKINKLSTKCNSTIEVVKGSVNLGVRGEDFEVLFSNLFGGLVSYRYAGKELLKSIPKPNFWRAPTDNDIGNIMPVRYAQWKIASLYSTHKYNNGTKLFLPEIKQNDESISITYRYMLPTEPRSECLLTYTVYGDGMIHTTLKYDSVAELGDMPEFGVMFKLSKDINKMEWYGLGPEDTYADRNRGAKLGIYNSSTEENMAKYIVPQECGNKSGVRWAKLTNNNGYGLIFKGNNINFSALPYTPHEVENAMHPYELPQPHYTVVRVSKAQMGLAGDDSWGALTHPEYLLNIDGVMEFNFSFKGI